MTYRCFQGEKFRFFVLGIVCLGGVSLHCEKQELRPRMALPGYNSELLFRDDFDADLAQWAVEGDGRIEITADNRLSVALTPESKGIALWTAQDFSDNFHLEYEVEIPETPGMNLAFICARGIHGENILEDLPSRSGTLNEYTRGQIRNYHISYHAFSPDGQHIPGSKVRKNPGFMLLASTEEDPCAQNRPYFIDIVKLDNRILFFVDGRLIHDLKDKGGFGPAYMEGKIGFWIYGAGGIFRTIFDNVRVFKLTPK